MLAFTMTKIMKLNLYILLILILVISCKEKQKTENISKQSSGINIQLDNIPILNDTLKLKRKGEFVTLTSSEPFISYKTKNNFRKQIINIDTRVTSANFNILDEDTIFLKVRYDFSNFKTFVLVKGDSAIINFKNGIPKLINRKHKKYDFKLLDFLEKNDTALGFKASFFKYKRMRNKTEREKVDKERQFIYSKKIHQIDSLKNLGQLSNNVYEYNRKYIFYMQQTKNEDIENAIRGNVDLHIDTYIPMIFKYIENNINEKTITTSSGFVQNSIESFDFVYNNKLFNDKTKEVLLFHFLKGIAENFSIKDFENKLSKFSEIVINKDLITELQNKYLIDLFELKKKTEDVYLIDANNKKNSLKEILAKNKGKLIFIDFWASWCAPCRKAIPDSKKMIQYYVDKKIVFIYISIDKNAKNWRKALQEENLGSFKNSYLSLNYPKAIFFKELELKSIPRYLLFDKNGKLIHKNAPSPNSSDIRKLIDKHLK